MRKRTVALFVILAALVCLAVSQVYSYFSKTLRTDNIITYGSLRMELIQKDENGPIPLRGEEAVRLIASDGETDVTRDISVKNICDHPMYVRLKLSITGQNEKGETFQLGKDHVQYAVQEGWKSRKVDDGWYYYENILQPGEDLTSTTKSLLTGNTVTFLDTKSLAKANSGLTLHIDVQVQAVQSEHNPEEGGVFDALGWPEEVQEP